MEGRLDPERLKRLLEESLGSEQQKPETVKTNELIFTPGMLAVVALSAMNSSTKAVALNDVITKALHESKQTVADVITVLTFHLSLMVSADEGVKESISHLNKSLKQ